MTVGRIEPQRKLAEGSMHTNILVIEDDPLVAMMLEEYLEALGGAVAGNADNVTSALAIINSETIDAAIVDIHLANGETSVLIAESLRARNIPFAIVTGGFFAPPDAAFAGRPVLLKPFTFASLEEALSKL